MLATTTSAASTAARPGQGRPAAATADDESEHGHRPDAAHAIRESPDQRVRGCLEGGRAKPERADRESREAELVQAQRREHAQRSEEERGQDDEPDTEQDPAVRSARSRAASGWDSTGGRRRPERPDRKRDGERARPHRTPGPARRPKPRRRAPGRTARRRSRGPAPSRSSRPACRPVSRRRARSGRPSR